ncbi:MAG: DUF488 domain-containing protein [Candidatus Omnitrophica bacterium]|nr:DUF488 domain-containing protein [Candidatus Omnitrophota bacterium]MDD5737791.1 DUF488 domain-containing protein [Candidatus Omnitrophota bacterium]
MKLFTIGFTKKSAEDFFESLKKNNVKKLIDIRLNTKSQLAGFAKQNDLKYFLQQICKIEYLYMPNLAPSKELLDGYQDKRVSWEQYEKEYLDILEGRKILSNIDYSVFNNACFLCSEDTPEQCHRRLAAEYLARANKEIEIVHL